MEQQNQQVLTPSQAGALSSVGELLSRAWQIYKERFATLIPISFVGLAMIPFVFINEKNFLAAPVWVFIWMPFACFLAMWEGAAMLFAVKDRGENIGFGESFKKGLRKIRPLLLTTVLVMLAVLGGFMLLIIPGVIFGVWFTLSIYIVVAENLSGAKAMSRSKQLVKGNFWGVFGRTLLVGIIIGAISGTISVISGLILGKNFGNVFPSLISIFTGPFVTVYTFLIYEELKKIKG